LEIKTKYIWIGVLPFVRFLVIVTTIYLGIIYAIQWLVGVELSNLQSLAFPFIFAMLMLFTGRRKRLTVRAEKPEELKPLLIEEIENFGYTAVGGELVLFEARKSVLNYMENRSIVIRQFSDTVEIEGPGPRVSELEDKLRFGKKYRSFK